MYRVPVDTRVLLILKSRENPYGGSGYSGGSGSLLSSGLQNSASFIVRMLLDLGITAEAVTVRDNNDIDREVTKFKPTLVVIEAYWVVPEKFDVLKKLHPTVKWVVRNHSKSEFLSNEGIAFQWTVGYLRKGVGIACNSIEATRDIQYLAQAANEDPRLVHYLPNYYPLESKDVFQNRRPYPGDFINIGCFGAIRPLKNQMVQALAAIQFAEHHSLRLKFHMNSFRVESKGDNVVKNLKALFASVPKHQLVDHQWLDHKDFLMLVAHMHMVLQVSFSETYNIVSADAVSQGVPIVVSDQIPWAPKWTMADPNDAASIRKHMDTIYTECKPFHLLRLRWQQRCLRAYNKRSSLRWAEALSERAALGKCE